MPETAPIPASSHGVSPRGLSDKLSRIRDQVIGLEQDIVDSARSRKAAKSNLKKIKMLLELQQMEKDLGKKRMEELETTIGSLESRRGVLRERILVHRRAIHRSLVEIERSERSSPQGIHLPEAERLEAPRRKVLSNRVGREIREIEALKADLVDADQLEARIAEEKQHLAFLFQDMKEKESVLELNRQLQADLLRRGSQERVAQLENYRNLKSAESQVERLMKDFDARMELEKAVETERVASKAMMQGAFAKLKGKLALPARGEVVSNFGRYFDPKSNLYIFKKGIDISAGKKMPVLAVSSGKVAYAGELPNYGRITIIDHGDHFYSLCGNLGELERKVGDAVAAGDPIGTTDDSGTPVYFEIRARNVAVNPLQWVSN